MCTRSLVVGRGTFKDVTEEVQRILTRKLSLFVFLSWSRGRLEHHGSLDCGGSKETPTHQLEDE